MLILLLKVWIGFWDHRQYMEVCQPRTYAAITVSEACYCWLVITSYLCAWCPPLHLTVVGGEQLSLHSTNGLVDTRTNTCTQITVLLLSCPKPDKVPEIPFNFPLGIHTYNRYAALSYLPKSLDYTVSVFYLHCHCCHCCPRPKTVSGEMTGVSDSVTQCCQSHPGPCDEVRAG